MHARLRTVTLQVRYTKIRRRLKHSWSETVFFLSVSEFKWSVKLFLESIVNITMRFISYCMINWRSRINSICSVKWYMKCFIYWTAVLKWSKPWSSQLRTQFKQLRIEAWKSQDFTPLKSWLFQASIRNL